MIGYNLFNDVLKNSSREKWSNKHNMQISCKNSRFIITYCNFSTNMLHVLNIVLTAFKNLSRGRVLICVICNLACWTER